MKDRIIYEYVIENIDENGDIVDLLFYDNIRQLISISLPNRHRKCIMKTTGNNNEDVKDKSYAYFIDGKLPNHFDDGIKVPQKYLKELS